MNDWILSASVGLTLIMLGSFLLRTHARTWQRQKDDASLDDAERMHFHKRFRRRRQASGIIALLGVLIPAGDIGLPLIPLQKPLLAAVVIFFWVGVLLLTLWVILLGFADMLATSAHARVSLNRIQRKQRELHQQIAEIKRRSANGRETPPE